MLCGYVMLDLVVGRRKMFGDLWGIKVRFDSLGFFLDIEGMVKVVLTV